jgi:hypothetical protein
MYPYSHRCGNLIHGIQILIEDLVHGKHMDAILLENRAHRIVAPDLALVGRVLQVALLDVLPDLLDGLGARGEGGGQGHWFLSDVRLACGRVGKGWRERCT